MDGLDWLMMVLVVMMYLIGCYLLVSDLSKNNILPMSKIGIAYVILMFFVTIGIGVALCLIYKDNTVLHNMKRLALLNILWPVAFVDFKTYRIPNLFLIVGALYRVVILMFECFFDQQELKYVIRDEFVASIALFVAAVLCAVIIKNSIGFGDIKLFLLMGLMLGIRGVWGAVFLALFISMLISIFLLITKKKTKKDAIPFGPAIMLGTYLSVFLTGM